MISDVNIRKTLESLDTLFNDAATATSPYPLQTYYSKLALLELCGWMEEVMDEMLKEYCYSELSDSSNSKYFNEAVVDKNYGFGYDENLRNMLMKLIGIVNLEHLEIKVNSNGHLDILKSQLGDLLRTRRKVAHTSLTGVTLTFDSPIVILGYLNRIYPILQELQFEMSYII